MVFVSDFGGGDLAAGFNNELAYDLRQIYAKIVGEHLEDIAIARKSDNYLIYFKALKDLKTIITHKFKHLAEDEKGYNDLINIAVELANKYPLVWLGKLKDPEACNMIETSLNNIETYLYLKMNDAAMFGSSKRIEGL
jgi:hypothetical protein